MNTIQIAVPLGDRAGVADAIDRLLALLDSWEGDPDLEENGDERDASFPNDPNARGGDPQEDSEDSDTGIGDYEGLMEVTGAAA
jgi:hypothetical protein